MRRHVYAIYVRCLKFIDLCQKADSTPTVYGFQTVINEFLS